MCKKPSVDKGQNSNLALFERLLFSAVSKPSFRDKIIELSIHLLYGPHREKTGLQGFANNTGADQPAHPRSLLSAFVIRFSESIICKLATDEISIF